MSIIIEQLLALGQQVKIIAVLRREDHLLGAQPPVDPTIAGSFQAIAPSLSGA